MKKSKLRLFQRGQKILLAVFALFLSLSVVAQQSTVTGVVLDALTNEPLIGVAVTQKGASTGTITDIDGNFSINVPLGTNLVISYIGYQPQEVKALAHLKILLSENTQALDEIVVVGYGTQKKVNLTGAIAAVDGSTIAAKSSSNVLAAMQGEMPGVAVLRSSGKPGSETSGMRVRGFSSINSVSALVLIDGVEGDLTLLNPDDISNISVLKDAAASSIYGARAAGGVVLVTTKTGQVGTPRVSYNGYFAVNNPTNMPERLPAWEEQVFINESRMQAGGTPEWNAEQSSWIGNPNFNYRPNNTNGRWDLFQATDWVRAGTRDYTTQQNHSVSISGGSKDINYLVSGNFFTKNGILKYGPDKNERYNLRVKLGAVLNKYMDLSINASYNGNFTEENPYGAENILERLYRVRGRQPIFNPEEDVNYKTNPYNGDLQVNPIQLMKEGGLNESRYEAYMGKGELNIKDLLPGLRFKLSASRQAGYYNNTISRRTLIWYDRLGTGIRFAANNPNSLEKVKNYTFHDNFEALAYYDLKKGKHTFNLLGGTTYENYRKDEMKGVAKNLNSNDFPTFNGYDSSQATNTELSDKIETWAMMSYFGRFNYNFDDRYLFEANIRYDGSSRLAPSNRWKAFPSFSFGWRINEEAWFNVPQIDNLKFRASWGQLGIGDQGLYDYLAVLKDGSLMGDKYYYQEKLPSVTKTWEVLSTTNIGLDVNVLANRLTFTADYYWKRNNDMLIDYNLPNLVGVNAPVGNIGEMKSWGWELQASWKDKVGDVRYQVGFNLSDSQNELIKLNNSKKVSAGSNKLIEGYALNTIWGYKTDGYWSSRDEYLAYKAANPGYQSFNDANVGGGDVRYVAQGKADHIIGAGGGTPDDSGDLVYLGDSNGRYLFGFNLGAQWKNFDISVLFQGVLKRKILIDTNTLAPFQATSNMPWTIHRDYWTPDNTDAFWPRLYNQNTFNYNPSDKWVQNAAYIRLKNIQFGYNIPIKKTIAQKLRVYVSGDDIWEHSDLLKVFDPEVGNDAKATYYPFFRTWSFGVNLTF